MEMAVTMMTIFELLSFGPESFTESGKGLRLGLPSSRRAEAACAGVIFFFFLAIRLIPSSSHSIACAWRPYAFERLTAFSCAPSENNPASTRMRTGKAIYPARFPHSHLSWSHAPKMS